MQSILDYFNTFLAVVFGVSDNVQNLTLIRPYTLRYFISNAMNGASDPWVFLQNIFSESQCFSIIFSVFVWSWFAVLVFKLLLTYPYKWIHSVVTRK